MEEITPEIADKISDANEEIVKKKPKCVAISMVSLETSDKIFDAKEEIVKKKPGRPRLLCTSLNLLSHWRTSLYQFLIVLRKY